MEDLRRIADAVIASLLAYIIESTIDRWHEPSHRPKHRR